MTRSIDPDSAAAIMRGAGVEPTSTYPGSDVPWQCLCRQCGREVRPRFRNVRAGSAPCGYCSGQLVDPVEAIALMRAAALEPIDPYKSVMTPWRCLCKKCGKEVSPLLNNIKKGQTGCAWCAGIRVDSDAARALMLAASLEPLVPYPGRHTPWKCRCMQCNKVVTPCYGAVKRGTGCKYCRDTAIKPDAAVKLMRSVSLEPLEPYPGSLRDWKCLCLKCDKIVSPCYSTVQRGNGGCRWCRDSGFKSAREAMVYLIHHPIYEAAKVGITDKNGSRLTKHKRRGWQIQFTLKVPGEVALQIEHDILDLWRNRLKLPAYLGSEEMPDGGWTETVDVAAIDTAATIRRIRSQAGWLQGGSLTASGTGAAQSLANDHCQLSQLPGAPRRVGGRPHHLAAAVAPPEHPAPPGHRSTRPLWHRSAR